MEFNTKQRREESEEEEQETFCAKIPRFNANNNPALPLFTTTHLHFPPSDHPTTPTKLPRGGMGSYFSVAQWQELELQALIFRHLMAGAAVPPELLHLVKKSLISSPSPYYMCNPALHYQYHPSLLQCGYWGKAAMDPEPWRCRRTDGKKWRCSRDVVAGQKYCERHMHRGRNRSRKPVEIPPSTTTTTPTPFSLSGPFSTSTDIPRNVEDGKYQNSGRLRHFFDDWPRSSESENEGATNLSISTSDFSLKLGSSNSNDASRERERDRGWAAPMGGPLAEALRSGSPSTVLLHRLQTTSAWETGLSFVTS